MKHRTIPRVGGFPLRWPVVLFLTPLVFGSFGCKPREALMGPATVEQAARVIDLTTFPLMPGAAGNPNRAVASLNYAAAQTSVKAAFDFQRQKLTAQGWQESSHDTSVSDQAASTTFKKNGFVLSVSVYSSGDEGRSNILLINHGNINYDKLPRPGGSKPVYVGDSSGMYVTEAAVASTTAECRRLLLADGWQPYGTAGDSAWFKKNAIRLIVTVSSAPAQGGKTMISLSSELMSADLPAPERADDLRYSDMTKELSFETPDSKEAMTAFYKRTLGLTQWAPTLEKTVDIDDKPTMIFRNPAKDMLRLSFSSERQGKTPVSLVFQSAAEIAELDRQIKAQAPRIKAEMEKRQAKEAAEFAEARKPLPKLPITLPGGAKNVEQSASEIKFTVAKGQARAIAEAWRKQFRDTGWKEDMAMLQGMAGALSFSREKQSLTVHYSDTGFTPAEVSLSAVGAELELSGGEKPPERD